jgi:hypothetical protein
LKRLSSEIELKLRSLHATVSYIFVEPQCTARFYGAKQLDDECILLGQMASTHPDVESQIVQKSKADSDHMVFVASRLQKSGGHTRVIEDFASLLPHGKKTIVVTEVPARSDRILEAKLQDLGVKVLWAPRGNLYKKLVWLQRTLLALNPGTVYLFNHHEDSVAIAGMSVLGDIDKYFYHHADHHFCLGLHLKGFKHIDFHAFGYHRCRNESQITDNIYLPLTASDFGVDSKVEFMQAGQLVTCSAAGHNKLEVPHFVSYFDLIPELLAKTGGKHIHIGKLSWFARRKLQWNLRKAGVDSSNFVYVPWVPSVWKALQAFQVDLFIASFPIVGGKTLVEVMGAGVPLVVHDNPVSRFLGGVDMAYPSAFCWREPEQLIEFCKSVNTAMLRSQSQDARAYYEQYHYPELIRQALQEGKQLVAPPLNPHVSPPSDLLAALQVCRENTPLRWLRKNLYRKLKIWRSRIHCYF